MTNLYEDVSKFLDGNYYTLGSKLLRFRVLMPERSSMDVVFDVLSEEGKVIGSERGDIREAYLYTRVSDPLTLQKLSQLERSALENKANQSAQRGQRYVPTADKCSARRSAVSPIYDDICPE